VEGRWQGTLQDRLDADAREEQGVLPPDVQDAAQPPAWMQPRQPRPSPQERRAQQELRRAHSTGDLAAPARLPAQPLPAPQLPAPAQPPPAAAHPQHAPDSPTAACRALWRALQDPSLHRPHHATAWRIAHGALKALAGAGPLLLCTGSRPRWRGPPGAAQRLQAAGGESGP
jgi:hypothetical protein